MNPEPTTPQRENALALIAGIERASRRSRPFFLFGLLAVILGFVSVSVYLYQDREEERAQKAVLKKQVDELNGTLQRARGLLPALDDSAAAREQLRILLGQASATARALPAAVAAAESGNPAPSSPPAQPPAKARPPQVQRPSPATHAPAGRRPARRPDGAHARPATRTP